ncbi:PsbP-related protein [Ferruginibacter sp.]
MKLLKNSIIFFFLLVPFIGKTQDTNAEQIQLSHNGYTISFPSTWTLDSSKKVALLDIFISSPKDTVNDNFSENVNVVIQDLSSLNLTPDQYLEANREQIKKLATNLKFIEDKKIQNGTKEFYKFIFTSTQGIFKLETEQYYFISNNKAYIITLTTEEKKYPAYQAVGEKILDSFRLID